MTKRMMPALLALVLLTGCAEKLTDSAPTEETTAVTEPPVIETTQTITETVTEPQAAEGWIEWRYQNTETDPGWAHLRLDGEYKAISCMVGGIEQRFYEIRELDASQRADLAALASSFSGTEITAEQLKCMRSTLSDSATGTEKTILDCIELRTDAVSLTRSNSGGLEIYDPVLYQKEPVSEDIYRMHPSEMSQEIDSGERLVESRTLEDGTSEYIPKPLHLLDGDYDIYDVNKWIFRLCREPEDPAEQAIAAYLAGGSYDADIQSITVKHYEDGTESVFCELTYEDKLPVIADGAQPRIRGDRMIVPTSVTVGYFKGGKIGYFQSAWLHGQEPDSVVLTDPRSHQPGKTLLTYEEACAAADAALDTDRTVNYVQLQYGALALYHDGLAGYVLTPFWHFAGYREMGMVGYYLDVDAVSGDVYERYEFGNSERFGAVW